MDINTLRPEAVCVVHLSHPKIGLLWDDKEQTKPVTISICSPSADKVVEFQSKESISYLESFDVSTGKFTGNADILTKSTIDKLVAYTAAVENLTYDGETLTPDNIIKLYSDPDYSWICDQLYRKTQGWEGFFS